MTKQADDRAKANRQLMQKLLVVVAVMFGFGFALVPFYEKICEVTGIRDVFQPDAIAAQNTQVDSTRRISVEFDANTQRLAWTFRPLQASVSVRPGEVTQVVYEVRNTLERPVTGKAVPSYSPQTAENYIEQLVCVRHQLTTLAPGEVRRMPVVFVIDPK